MYNSQLYYDWFGPEEYYMPHNDLHISAAAPMQYLPTCRIPYSTATLPTTLAPTTLAPTTLAPTTTLDPAIVAYGDLVQFQNTNPGYGGTNAYITICGDPIGNCGPNVSLPPTPSTDIKVRQWRFERPPWATRFTPVIYGDTVKVSSAGATGYLSLCNSPTITNSQLSQGCGPNNGTGINVTVRPPIGGRWQGDWMVTGGTTGSVVRSGDIIKLKALGPWSHLEGGFLSMCGWTPNSNVCGVNINQYHPDPKYSNWRVLK